MGKKISPALKAKLLKQKSAMKSGLIINNKNFTKARLRLLPCGDDLPGREYIEVYSDQITVKDNRKSSASPRSFGYPCPVMDALENIKRTGDKATKDFAYKVVRPRTEYWMGVIDREDPGTPESPKFRIMRGKQTEYSAILDRMMDEDDGEDVTDAVAGRDFRRKKVGSGLETEWKITFLDASPLTDDEDQLDAMRDLAEKFDVRDHFYKVNWDVIEAIYEALVGEEVPDHYLENKEAMDGKKGTPKPDDDDDDEEEEEEKPAPKSRKRKSGGGGKKKVARRPEPEPEPEEEEEEEEEADESNDDGIVVGETYVEFEVEGEDDPIQGLVVSAADPDEDGDIEYEIRDADGGMWNAFGVNLTVIDPPEDEPEEVEPTEPPAEKSKKAKAAKKSKGGSKKVKRSATDNLKERIRGSRK